MFADGSTLELIKLNVAVGDVSGIVEYTIDQIKYVDGYAPNEPFVLCMTKTTRSLFFMNMIVMTVMAFKQSSLITYSF